MARAKKDGEKISFYVDRQVMEDLRAYAEEKGQTVTMAMERFCDHIWIEKKEKRRKMSERRKEFGDRCDTVC